MNADSNDLDAQALAEYLRAHLSDVRDPLKITKFPTGQSNPTFRLDTPTRSYVLRRKPAGTLLPSAHAIDREFRVMQALHDTPVPVPHMYVYCEDETVIGSSFYVMELVEGRNVVDPRIPEFGQDNQARATVYDEMNSVLSAIHSVDVGATGLEDYGKPGNYYARQIERWDRQYNATVAVPDNNMQRLTGWLKQHTPDDDGQVSLVHGDYRIDNLLVDATTHRVVAVLDWELSTLGHPLADLAYQCMQWRMPVDAPLQGLEGVDRAAFGIPEEADYVAEYCRRRNIAPIENWPFYLAFSFFRLAAILEGVRKRATAGNASNPEKARRLGGMVPQLTERAVEIIE